MTISSPRHIDSGGDLFQHLPGLLNYTPDRHLVVVGCRDTDAITTATISLAENDPIKMVRCAGIIAEALGNELCTSAKLLFVDPADDRLALFHHCELSALLANSLSGQDITKLESFRTRRIAAGERWVFVDDEQIHGVIGEPTASFLLAESVTRGERQYISHEELEQEFATASPARLAEIAAVETDLDGQPATITNLVEWVDAVAAGKPVPDVALVVATIALRDRHVLAEFVAVAVSRPDPSVAEFAQQIGAVTTGADRANACVVAAANCYVRGRSTHTHTHIHRSRSCSARRTQPPTSSVHAYPLPPEPQRPRVARHPHPDAEFAVALQLSATAPCAASRWPMGRTATPTEVLHAVRQPPGTESRGEQVSTLHRPRSTRYPGVLPLEQR
ncbi:DUF4192 family protein [Nocardia sp. NPDC049220]|uniref:DUF4192 family protein n=1 Tax=Nocardia sp. NPDC049220 TaxID=3155273 RepID=UPI0033CC63BB